MRRRRRPGGRGALVALLLWCLVLAGCTGGGSTAASGPSPEAAVAKLAAAWASLNPDSIAALTSDPGSAAASIGSVLTNLAPTSVVVKAGQATESTPTAATVSAAFAWTLPHGVSWNYTATWSFARPSASDDWTATWSSTLINPQLGDGQSLDVRSIAATDGIMVDRNDQQIVAPVTVYSVIALPGKITDLTGTAAALAKILGPLDPTVTTASVAAGVKAATATAGYTVTNLRQADYDTVKAQLGAINGLTFPSTVRDLPPTKDFAKMLLAEVTPAAAKITTGIDGWEIDTVDATGAELATLATQAPRNGQKVTLTIDTAAQKAAEKAVATTKTAAVLVAIQPSTGEILAVAQNAAANQLGPIALQGQFPPGSTFKIITATAAFERNLVTPTTQVACPGVVVFDSRPFHNAHDFDLGSVDVTKAFARSCNTTFARLATEMPSDALPTAAVKYGVGSDFVVPGITTLTGKVLPADTLVQRAANGFGQGTDLVSPFSEAMMAATVAHGSLVLPTVIRGTTTTVDQVQPAPSTAAISGLRTLMRAVVTEGTGAHLQDVGDVFIKTGTADFVGTDGKAGAHAWTTGYRGDVAFSILIVNGQSSGFSNLMAATFLKGLPGGP
ncbi:Cell division protein FtsI/penicillin-binding protein 2 [Nakamurella panacisegetis]|uniref:Cell division protein FtsI/penicillin-binding protein 2 n=2 Tax=Nakamurella panacisegetis TaxID=1090615 RepID=A0A1H0SK07_9ACTN|nr:Cell division protein FtsI/penicillin-binding protein 2 [Nakamurella panacisegetis]